LKWPTLVNNSPFTLASDQHLVSCLNIKVSWERHDLIAILMMHKEFAICTVHALHDDDDDDDDCAGIEENSQVDHRIERLHTISFS